MIEFIASAKKFILSEEAPTMVEYGLLVALIAIAIVVAGAASVVASGLLVALIAIVVAGAASILETSASSFCAPITASFRD